MSKKAAKRLTLHWRHKGHDGVTNHQPHGCLLNRLFRRRSKKTSKLRVTGLCVENSPGPMNSPHKGPVTRKMFPFDDVIMDCLPDFFLKTIVNICKLIRQVGWRCFSQIRPTSHWICSNIWGCFWLAWIGCWTYSRVKSICDALALIWRHCSCEK